MDEVVVKQESNWRYPKKGFVLYVNGKFFGRYATRQSAMRSYNNWANKA